MGAVRRPRSPAREARAPKRCYYMRSNARGSPREHVLPYVLLCVSDAMTNVAVCRVSCVCRLWCGAWACLDSWYVLLDPGISWVAKNGSAGDRDTAHSLDEPRLWTLQIRDRGTRGTSVGIMDKEGETERERERERGRGRERERAEEPATPAGISSSTHTQQEIVGGRQSRRQECKCLPGPPALAWHAWFEARAPHKGRRDGASCGSACARVPGGGLCSPRASSAVETRSMVCSAGLGPCPGPSSCVGVSSDDGAQRCSVGGACGCPAVCRCPPSGPGITRPALSGCGSSPGGDPCPGGERCPGGCGERWPSGDAWPSSGGEDCPSGGGEPCPSGCGDRCPSGDVCGDGSVCGEMCPIAVGAGASRPKGRAGSR
mmetsp:Transcript_27057/g.86961  ORF Transcript_27057/g.86961 Transcript_27057/m.86961 type:complete len:374 (+) Transcript_27057:1505-2626(+)